MKVYVAHTLVQNGEQEARHYRHVQTLVEGAIALGRLSRQQEDRILRAILLEHPPTAALCGLFRQLQEQVWQGSLALDGGDRRD